VQIKLTQEQYDEVMAAAWQHSPWKAEDEPTIDEKLLRAKAACDWIPSESIRQAILRAEPVEILVEDP